MGRGRLAILMLLASVAVGHPQELPPAPPAALWTVATRAELLAAAGKVGQAGGTIVLKPGHYVLQNALVFANTNLVSIAGSGWNTQITRLGEGDAIVFTGSSFCTVRNLLINGAKDAASGSGIVFGAGCSSCTVESCRVCLFAESGVRFEGDDRGALSSNSVRSCQFINNGGDQLRSRQNNDFHIVGNQFGADRWGRAQAPRSGCLLENSSAGTYSENYHWNNVNALRMIGCKFNRIENNRFEQSRESGIVIGTASPWSGGAYNIFLGNTIHTNSEGSFGGHPAVVASHAAVFQFCTNQVFSWDSATTRHRNGLVLGAGCSRWIVKDNVIHHCTETAIVCEPDAGHVVRDNLVD